MNEIAASDRVIIGLVKTDANARRLMSVPGIGPITASAIAASVQDVAAFSGPREFAAFLGLAPRQNSSGGKERLGRVSKMGNRISENCWSSAPMLSSSIERLIRMGSECGRRSLWKPNRSSLSR